MKNPKFGYLDGQTILSYEKSSSSELKSEFSIPIGMAKKMIMYLNQRNSGHLHDLLQFEMAKWTVVEVQDFIRKSVAVQSNDIDAICNMVGVEQIDGLVFLSYKDTKELQLDVPGSKELGIIYRRIFLKRDELLKNNKLLQSNSVQTEPVLHVAVEDESSLKMLNQFPKSDSLLPSEWDSYIRNVLQLDICEEKSKATACSLSIINGEWRNRNLFEKKMLFFCLDKQRESLDKNHGSFIWSNILTHGGIISQNQIRQGFLFQDRKMMLSF